MSSLGFHATDCLVLGRQNTRNLAFIRGEAFWHMPNAALQKSEYNPLWVRTEGFPPWRAVGSGALNHRSGSSIGHNPGLFDDA
jgi:hypothetical protein